MELRMRATKLLYGSAALLIALAGILAACSFGPDVYNGPEAPPQPDSSANQGDDSGGDDSGDDGGGDDGGGDDGGGDDGGGDDGGGTDSGGDAALPKDAGKG